jgi:hypothetical protein
MKANTRIALMQVILLIMYACTGPQSHNSPDKEGNVDVIVIGDFEKKTDRNKWKGTDTLSKEFPAHGQACCKLTAREGQAVWIETEALPKDWTAFEYLKFDIYNPSPGLYFGNIQIFDEPGTDELAEFKGQSYNGEKIFLNTGWNHFVFLLRHAKVEEGDRYLALNRIRKLRFSFGSMDNPLFIDNIRLVAGEENVKTQSRIDPHDCVTVIDDRDVYPALAGPADQIRVSDEIIHLRKEALDATENLRTGIRIAEMQGYQTLYQRIPLITADVGMGIRSKLVWFQNEAEETKILQYVISSCRKASGEIHDMLLARQTDVLINAPEDEVNAGTFYVPPYPPLPEIQISDGFYRDKTGNPVLLLSMLQINEGPLTDYFAPFDHRLESYTVGGGSRYNIESSPVYEAFHKYPGTRRVGWDGWCGHLIKDRWAMGGKKEDMVICLESPHIRQAVLNYMQLHYREWTDNPNLLYNIMAYELQYICYCDKSQQMFRNWLISKYANIRALNQTWQTQYNTFQEIRAPETRNARPVDDINRAAWFDWASFNARRFTDYMKWIKSEMRKLDSQTPICAGGTSSMLSSSNSVTGIDEELIINEVDDVILNESGGSPIFSDLLLSLSDRKKVMVDPEMGGGTHGLLLHFLHGKSDIAKWWWAGFPSKEYMHMNQSSLPHSKEISLSDIDEVLRIGLDVRRLSSEIAEFTRPDPEISILYSKTSILQVPPRQIQAGSTPYIDALYSVWEGARFLGCRTGFISERQILSGKLSGIRLLIIPAVKYIPPETIRAIQKYIENGGIAAMIPESFVFDQYAREQDALSSFGLNIRDVTFPPVIGQAEKTQNYDQSFSQAMLYGEVQKKITCLDEDVFAGSAKPIILNSDGLVQTVDPGPNNVLARFDDGKPAIILVKRGKGSIYYLASPLKTPDYHLLFSPMAKLAGLNRPVVGVGPDDMLVTGAEVRAVERDKDYLVYASNLTDGPVEFDLQGNDNFGTITDLRRLSITGTHIKLEPFRETIFRIEKIR